MEVVYKTENGEIIHGDNIEVMKTIKENSIDSCISDFPYAIEFMNKNWDSAKHWHDGNGSHSEFKGTGYDGKRRPDFYKNSNEDKIKFYDWCYERAIELFRIIKSGGYVCIFGHPKTNHRMKSAFEDAGFDIVEEVDWVYGTGMPKNQDIYKLFKNKNKLELANQYIGFKTSGLKPAHEPITIFQKPLDGTYIQNIEKYNCGAMNIDACRIPTSQEDKDIINAKVSKNPTTNYSESETRIYGAYAEDKAMPANEIGRFPANMIFDSSMGEILNNQSGISKSTGGSGDKSKGALGDRVYGKYKNEELSANAGGLGDIGGASRYFLNINSDEFVPFYYCPKATKKEKGEENTHVTVKPKELIKWLIKLVTPINGSTIDITSGSGTHGVSCEELNKEGYNLKWTNIELSNTEDEPYCDIAIKRVKAVNI